MKVRAIVQVMILAMVAIGVAACGGEQTVDVKSILAKPQEYVGSDTCKMCHLEHYDSWKMTLHSRMLQDAKANVDVFVTDIDAEAIRADLTELSANKKFKVPVEEFHIPNQSDV